MTARDLMHELRECRTVADCHAFRASVPDEAMTSALWAALLARQEAILKLEAHSGQTHPAGVPPQK